MKPFTMKRTALGMALLISSSPILAADYDQHWAKDAITKWNTYQVIQGYENGDFRPNNPITRAELATILDRVFRFPEATSTSPYMDIVASSNKWYVAPVTKVTALNLMYIPGFLFEPNAPITREEAAYAIAKAYELTPISEEKTYFKDQDQVSSWAKEAVKTLAYYGYINGTPEEKFLPQGTLTRAEIVTMLNNMTSTLVTKSETLTQSVKGNVIINSQEAVLKNMTIEGNLYLTASVAKSTLENVKVTGTVYVRGGNLQMSGTYQEIQLATGAGVELTAGTIEKLVVNQAGSSLKVAENATIGEVIQNSPIEMVGQGTIGGQAGVGGGAGGGQIGQVEAPQLQKVEIIISGEAVQLPVSSDSVVIDLPSLCKQFSSSDTIDGFKIWTNTSEATLNSSVGSVEVGRMYSFRQLEDELGLIREVASGIGMSSSLIVDVVLGEGKVTLGSLLENYVLGKSLADSLGYTLEDSYTFERYLMNEQGKGENIYITLCLQ